MCHCLTHGILGRGVQQQPLCVIISVENIQGHNGICCQEKKKIEKEREIWLDLVLEMYRLNRTR